MRPTFGLLVFVLGCLVSLQAAENRPGEPVWYADLDRETLAALNTDRSDDVLQAVFEAGLPYRFEH
jgi:hypothetical protein